MGRTACTEPQCLYSTAIPLLPLWAVRPVQSLSACTVELYLYSPYGPYSLYRASVPVQYSYTSTPPMGRTACTEPQCLYNGALYSESLRLDGKGFRSPGITKKLSPRPFRPALSFTQSSPYRRCQVSSPAGERGG